jgi:hypothetical protein
MSNPTNHTIIVDSAEYLDDWGACHRMKSYLKLMEGDKVLWDGSIYFFYNFNTGEASGWEIGEDRSHDDDEFHGSEVTDQITDSPDIITKSTAFQTEHDRVKPLLT